MISQEPRDVPADLAALGERLRRITVRVRGSDRGEGAGVIWDAGGLVVTNAHVARSGRPVVGLPDGRSLTLHVLDLKDEAAWIRKIKQHYEQPIIRMFE